MTRPKSPRAATTRAKPKPVVPPGAWTPETVRALNLGIVCDKRETGWCEAWARGETRCYHKCMSGNLWKRR